MTAGMPSQTHSQRHGIVLFAHGSRDPLWHRPMQTVRELVMQSNPDVQCLCAYLEISEPSLPEAIAQLAAMGCTTIQVLPLFLGTGRHAREDLPVLLAACRDSHPQLRITVATPVGEDPRVMHLLAEIALDGAYKEHQS